MAATKEQRKVKAIEIMIRLDIYKPYIEGFEQNDYVCMYEAYSGFWTSNITNLKPR